MSARAPLLSLLAALAAAACDPGAAGGVDAGAGDPDAAAPRAQGGPPGAGPIVIDEVAADPDSGADWIEIVNRGDEPFDLCGAFVTDLADRLDHFHPLGGVSPPDPCPPRLLEPGERLVVHADDGAAPGIDRAGFALADADEVHLIAIDGAELDGLLYLLPQDHGGRSLARVPGGEGPFYLVEPTPGAANPEAP